MGKRMREYERDDIVWAYYKLTPNPRWIQVRILSKSNNGYKVWAIKNPHPLCFEALEQDITLEIPL